MMKAKILCSAIVLASLGLSGCMVSRNPAINAVATAGAIGAASLLYYSLNDGYYYDQDYRRMPRNYRPDANMRVQRVDNMDNYRQQRRNNGRGNNDNPAYRHQQPPRGQMNTPPNGQYPNERGYDHRY